ncbi:MAG TPA: rhodanese-like domain-containing protein [Balneolaceae bacterium]|nr:rhodanese-like domain-containing protein [Balneolaceae bacterium]
MKEITVQDFKAKLDNEDNNVLLLDVREPFEQYQSNIKYENATLIPLGELPERMDEIESYKNKEVVCMCRSGGRSSKACELLEEKGFTNVKNLKGGINEWAREVDTSLPVY